MWGAQQTRRDTCRPLQAWSFVGQLCMCSKWALPARRHWGAHFMVSPLTAVAHSPLLECAPRARWQAMQWAQFDGSAGGAGGGALCVFARLRVPV